MAHVLLDRAKVVATSMSGNTANYALTNSPPTGFVDFTGVGDGNTTYYTAADDAGNWEVGIGTFASSGEVLTRTDANVIKSTNSNNRVSWPSSSTPTVFITQPSDKAVYFDASSASSTSILNTGLVVGRDADNDIDFGTDNTIIFRAGGEDQLKLVDGYLFPVTDDNVDLGSSTYQFKNGYFDGTIYADAISNLGSITLEAETSGITYSGAGNSDPTIIRVGNDATQYGFNIKYMGSRSGNSNSLAIFTDQQTGGLASLEAFTMYQDGQVVFSNSIHVGDNFELTSDGCIIKFGYNEDVLLTHVHDTGLLLNSDMQLQFGDSGTYIHQSADGVLDLVSDTEIEINATTIDINGAVEVSGNLDVGGSLETATIDYTDGDNAITIADGGGTTFPQTATFTSGIQSNGTVTVGVDDTGHDVKFFGATSGQYMLWDESTDDLRLTADSGIDLMNAAGSAGLKIYHSSTVNDSYLFNYTGDVILMNSADDSDIALWSDDGSGGFAQYLVCDGSSGEVKLYHYGSEKLNTLSTGIEVTGNIELGHASDTTISRVSAGVIAVEGSNLLTAATGASLDDATALAIALG